jgi:hypothetical protein
VLITTTVILLLRPFQVFGNNKWLLALLLYRGVFGYDRSLHACLKDEEAKYTVAVQEESDDWSSSKSGASDNAVDS